jgi:hypothetical protein
MPTVTCPGCQKQYKLPDTAAGQVASCKCGKRFRVGGAAPVAASTEAPSAPQTSAKPDVAKAAAPTQGDDFWDKALSEPVKMEAPPPPKPAPKIGAATAPPDRRRKSEWDFEETTPKVRWGFDWGKVAAGGLTFLIAGSITVGLVITTGYLYFWPAGIAIVGLFTMLTGLMGEEGIW